VAVVKVNLLDGRAGLGDPSSAASVRRVLTRAGRRTLKAAAIPVLGAARISGLFGLPRGAIRADEVLATSRAKNGIRQWRTDLSEPRRVLTLLGVGDPSPETQAVTTSVTILDGPADTFAFSNNLVVDHHRRIVFPWELEEDGTPYRFRDLRASWTRLDRPRRVAGSVAYLSNTGVHNFGHWLLFIFPLVNHYRQYLGHDPDYYYVGTPVESWHYDSLATLGIERHRVVTDAVVGDRMLAAIADRAIPPPTSFLDFSTDALRRPRDNSKPGRRIYISRKLRSTRPLLNEEECVEVLEQYGFESYCTETLSLREETELFANAEVVAGVHGAGLANLLFCHPGCVVVELFPHSYPSAWFAEVSAARRITYANVRGLPTTKRGLRPIHYHALIDLERLRTVVAAATETAVDARRDVGTFAEQRSDAG
jgi:Glycosyltransferase 61